MPETRGPDNGGPKQISPDEIRCTKCGYFLCERIFAGTAEVGVKVVCGRCKARLIVKISSVTVTVGQV